MRFNRCPWTKDHTIPLTNRRIAATKRRLARQREAVALLPDLVDEVPKLEDDLAKLKASGALSAADWRAHWARNWRRGRADLAKLPPLTRKGLLRFWSQWSGPGSPEYFVTFVHQAAAGRSFWTELRQLRQFQLIGQKRFPLDRIKAVFQATRNRPEPLGRNAAFYRKRRAAKIARRRGETTGTARAYQMPLVAA